MWKNGRTNKPGISSTYVALRFSETAETKVGNKCREESREQEPTKTSAAVPRRVSRHACQLDEGSR